MRASEFITEGKRPGRRALAKHEFETAHPGLVGPHANDDTYWGRYYDFYRVATLAGMDLADLEKTDDISFFGNLPLFSAYTEHDRKKLIAIMKKLGMKPDTLISNGSHETNGVNNVSPVKSFRGYAR
jgi:hypothetical protein|tara:strand:+ start:1423 stop:1803 length:381 start_codon:yes stop_codon:yes gene_type:complete